MYFIRVGVAISVLFSVLLGGRSNQTFSARNHVWKRRGRPNLTYIIDMVFGEDHCLLSWVYWATHRHTPTLTDLEK